VYAVLINFMIVLAMLRGIGWGVLDTVMDLSV